MLHFIGFLITGFIVGLAARVLKPGDDKMGWGKTTILGMIGAIFAGWLGHALGWYQADEGAGFLAATVGAIVVLSVYYAISGSRNRLIHH